MRKLQQCVRSDKSLGSVEDDGAVAAEEHAVFKHKPQGAGKDHLFDVPAGLHEILRRVSVVDWNHLLYDDRALIKLGRDEMRRGANDLHSALERLMVRLCTGEGGKE